MPISHHFHDCTALLVWRFVVVKWRYIKYKALPFTFYSRVAGKIRPGQSMFNMTTPNDNDRSQIYTPHQLHAHVEPGLGRLFNHENAAVKKMYCMRYKLKLKTDKRDNKKL